jgi:hypothetical protein
MRDIDNELNAFSIKHPGFFKECQRIGIKLDREAVMELLNEETIDGMVPVEWLESMTMD